jgi:hypothetical protein
MFYIFLHRLLFLAFLQFFDINAHENTQAMFTFCHEETEDKRRKLINETFSMNIQLEKQLIKIPFTF